MNPTQILTIPYCHREKLDQLGIWYDYMTNQQLVNLQRIWILFVVCLILHYVRASKPIRQKLFVFKSSIMLFLINPKPVIFWYIWRCQNQCHRWNCAIDPTIAFESYFQIYLELYSKRLKLNRIMKLRHLE